MKQEEMGILEAVKYAIQMEIDGKQFYTLSGKNSDNRVSKELFAWLAVQEDYHRKRCEEIFRSIAAKKGWPASPTKHDRHPNFRTLFSEALGSVGTGVKPQKGDMASADKAVEMEIKSRDFYAERARTATSPAEKDFFSAVSAEEQGHYLALVDYKEYLTDPAGFFTRSEHTSLDG